MAASFSAVNTPGAHFAEQFASGGESGLDAFTIIGLHADGSPLSAREIRKHVLRVVIPHVFERGETGAETTRPMVPTWAQVNQVIAILDALNEEKFAALQEKWKRSSRQTWNPFAERGSPAALRANHASGTRKWNSLIACCPS